MRSELTKTGFGVRAKTLAMLAAAGLASVGMSQTAYFADGYHGGVHGHYPDWTTRFMLDMLKQHPRWKINLEIEPETWDRARTNDPAAYHEFKALVADQSSQARIEFVNPAYAQPYLWNISGESAIRQFRYGMRRVQEHFPGVMFTTYASEEPCFTSALPGILNSLGFKFAVLKNPDTCWGGYTRAFGGEWVNWLGPDGSTIPTVPRYAIESLQPRSTWQTIAWNNSPAYLEAARKAGIAHPVGMCLQDAGWKNGPWLGEGRNPAWPTEYVTWRGYFQNTLRGRPPEDWHFSQEDVLVSLVWGSQVLQRLAEQVRAAENQVIMAEKLAALASLYAGAAWPADTLDGAWRNLMLAQHHDCWIVPYNGRAGNTWADKVALWTGATRTASDGIMRQAASDLSAGPEHQASAYIRVFNTLGVRRTDVVNVALPTDWPNTAARVLDDNGREVPAQVIFRDRSMAKELLFQAEVPALGYGTYQVQRTAASVSTQAGASIQDDGTCEVETDFYRIVLDPAKGGALTSLRAKSLGNREFVDGANARRFNELRGFFHEDGQFHSSTETPATIKILENGPVRACLEVSGKVGTHPFTQTISVAQGQRRIDFSLRLDWIENPGVGSPYGQKTRWRQEENQRAFYDDRDKFLALFPANLKAQCIFKNAPFDVTESKLTDTFFTTWDGIKNNIILNWMDVSEAVGDHGLALLTDHTTSYIHGADHPPGLVLQYSGIGLWGRRYGINGPTSVRYALIPHAGRWDRGGIPTESARWNEPLVATSAGARSALDQGRKSMMDLTGTGWEVTALIVEGKTLLVRLFNAEGDNSPRQVRFDGNAGKVELVELNGEVRSRLEIISDNPGKIAVKLAIPRFGIRTLRFTGMSPMPREGTNPPG
jgi:alpha-mannosidase